jgi:hypothetical protein
MRQVLSSSASAATRRGRIARAWRGGRSTAARGQQRRRAGATTYVTMAASGTAVGVVCHVVRFETHISATF